LLVAPSWLLAFLFSALERVACAQIFITARFSFAAGLLVKVFFTSFRFTPPESIPLRVCLLLTSTARRASDFFRPDFFVDSLTP
jgi:hypothetical protein